MSKVAPWLLMVVLAGCAGTPDGGASSPHPAQPAETQVNIDDITSARLQRLLALRKSMPTLDDGAVIERLSRQFLDVPYVADRLIGDAATPERLVIDFRGLDCFTYLDYVEALRHADDQAQFVRQLIATRYRNGEVGFLTRKHFFSDWAYQPAVRADDITTDLSPHAITLSKVLNRNADGGQYLPGLPNATRRISYIPSEYVDARLLSRLRTGDYIGIYTNLEGLDVTHVGIYIMTPTGPVLRNASSRKENRKVVDSPFIDYISSAPGIVVLRPR
ncbi:hypothetical protein CLM71_06195 [Serratia sp. MYb239]|uniref:DUF1460 domain-containing protein n=1 Tax=Serratia sp. MYb239 TaxID=2033438 RepID=UPI000CF60AE8|nr:DUF1460 domain-containing protein [Serratia sp. MYb239]AVJ16750.1 hypothetical protein CLM71_06195 [Serratia sp. MYb239]